MSNKIQLDEYNYEDEGPGYSTVLFAKSVATKMNQLIDKADCTQINITREELFALLELVPELGDLCFQYSHS